MARTSTRQAIACAVFAVADMGGTILLSKEDADRFEEYSFDVRKAILTDYKLACQSSSYVIKRPFYGNNQHGWRLSRLTPSTGQSYTGPMFLTTGAFADTMRMVSAMVYEKQGAK